MASSNGSSNDGDVLREPAGNADGRMQTNSDDPYVSNILLIIFL